MIAEVEPDKPAVKTAERDSKSKSTAAAQQLGLTVSDLSDAQKKELKLRAGCVWMRPAMRPPVPGCARAM